MRSSPALAVWLLAVWLLLWEELSVANVVSGVVVVVALALLFPADRPSRRHALRPIAAARWLLHFLWKLVEASAVVAWEVVTPSNRIAEGIIAVPLRSPSRGLATLVANAVSLTPGTLSVQLDDDPMVLYVHVLHLHDAQAVRDDIARLELLAIRAFADDPSAALARVTPEPETGIVSDSSRHATGTEER